MAQTSWVQGSRVLGQSTGVVVFAVLFIVAIGAVFFGFIGYYSRVSLSNELRQTGEGTSVDLLFMSVDQIAKDEKALADLRRRKNELDANGTVKSDALREHAFASPEFAEYAEKKEKLMKVLNVNRSLLTEQYWTNMGATLFKTSPDDYETEVALWTAVGFREGVTEPDKNQLYTTLTGVIEGLSGAYRKYNAKYLQPIYQILAAKQRDTDPIISEIRAIFARNPQLATADDR